MIAQPRRQSAWIASLAALLTLIALLAAEPAVGRGFSVNDLLRTESFAQLLIDPQERWLVIEKQDAWERASAYDLDAYAGYRLGRLMIVDLARPGPARELLPKPPGTAYVALGFSPRGTRLAVARLHGRQWELGVVTLPAGTPAWLGVTPCLPTTGRALQWRSETEFVARVQEGDALPVELRTGWQASKRLPRWWAATASGTAVAATAIGSGRYRSLSPDPPPNRLVRINLTDRRTTTLAQGSIADFEVAPDHRRIALLEEADPVQPTAQQLVGVGTELRRRRLVILNLKGRGSRSMLAGIDIAGGPLSWSASSRSLLVYGRQDGEPWGGGRLMRVDGMTGAARRIGPSIRTVVLGPPDFAARAAAGWMSEDPIAYAEAPVRGAMVAGWYRLARGEAIPLTPGLAAGPSALLRAGPSTVDILAGQNVWRIDGNGRRERIAHGTGLVALPSPDPQAGPRDSVPGSESRPITAIAQSRRSARLALPDAEGPVSVVGMRDRLRVRVVAPGRRLIVAEDIAAQGDTELILFDGAATRNVVATINAHLRDVTPACAVPIAHSGPDGRMLQSWLYLPPAPALTPPPLIVLPYPGAVYGAEQPSDQGPGLLRFYTNAALLTAHGYAVLTPSLPPRKRGEPAEGLADQILGIVDVAAKRGLVDKGRLGLWGHSFGGYAAGMVATQTDRFRAIVASAGLYDLVSLRGTFIPARRVSPEDGLSINATTGWVEQGQAALGVTPWDDPQRYTRNSPVFAAGRIFTPMLLIHGDQDVAPLAQAEEMFSSLYRQNKDAVLVTYWGEGHVVISPANVRDLYARVFAWFDAHLRQDIPVVRHAGADPQSAPARCGPRIR